MPIEQAQVIYDNEFGIPFPTSLFNRLKISDRDIVPVFKPLSLNEGAGPIFASIVIRIRSNDDVWDYTVENVITGLGELTTEKWFGEASDKAQEMEKILLQETPTNPYEKIRQKMLSKYHPPRYWQHMLSMTSTANEHYSMHLPYSLMNIFMSNNKRGQVEILFPYPITDIQVEKAIPTLRKTLECETLGYSTMIYDRNAGGWITKGTLKSLKSL